MANVIETTGKTIEEAIRTAVAQLGVDESELTVEVLETPSKRLFGLLGEKPARIRATVKVTESPVQIAEPAPIEEVAVEPDKDVVVETVAEPIAETPATEPVEVFEPVLEPSPVEEVKPVNHEQILNDAEKFLQDVFAAMGLEVTIKTSAESENAYVFDLVGKNLGVLIGRRGQALDSLQYLLNLSINRKLGEDRLHLILDVEDYRRRREETLIKLAKSVAERAIKTRHDVRLEPMNRHERKIIHTVLQENDRVETHSSGEDPYRYVIVTPVKRGKH